MTEDRDRSGEQTRTGAEGLVPPAGGLLASPGPFTPLVTFVSRINASVFAKLLSGFLVGALLLLGMGVLSLVVISRMSHRVDEINVLHGEADRARQMIYSITAQSHYRAMALVCQTVQMAPTPSSDDCTANPPWNDRIAASKGFFVRILEGAHEVDLERDVDLFGRVREANTRYSASGQQVLALYRTGQSEDALKLHIAEEHEISHELESTMQNLIMNVHQDIQEATEAFDSDKGVLKVMVGAFSGISLALAVLLGFVLSWLVIDPLRRMGFAMSRIAAGNFSHPVHVENRDELGDLAGRVNQTAGELARLQEATLADERAQALRERIAQVATAQEEERRRISRELHDGLGPSLAAISNRIRVCRSIVREDSDRAEKELDDIASGLTGHIQEIRALIHDLRPLILDQLGLVEALKQHVSRFGLQSGLSASFEAHGDIVLNPLAEVTVFRVVQECLGNVQSHADASVVEVSLHDAPSGLEVTVLDDGRGFDPREVASDATKQGMGLVSMRERAEVVRGHLAVESSPGRGCRVTLRIPLQEKEIGTDSDSLGG